MFTREHVQQNQEMLAVALEVTAEYYDHDRDCTSSFHEELKSKVFDALAGFDVTKGRKRSIQAKALRLGNSVSTLLDLSSKCCIRLLSQG